MEFVMAIDLRQLRQFVTIAELGSYRRAAEALHIAQPALSVSEDNGVTWSPFMSQPPNTTKGGQAAVNANGTRIVWVPEDSTGAFVSSNTVSAPSQLPLAR